MSNYRRYVSEALDTHLLWLALPHSNRELAEATLRASRLSSPPPPSPLEPKSTRNLAPTLVPQPRTVSIRRDRLQRKPCAHITAIADGRVGRWKAEG